MSPAPGLIVSSMRTFSLLRASRDLPRYLSLYTCYPQSHGPSRLPYNDNGRAVKEGNEEQIVDGDHRGVNDGEAARKKSHGVMNLAPPTIRPPTPPSSTKKRLLYHRPSGFFPRMKNETGEKVKWKSSPRLVGRRTNRKRLGSAGRCGRYTYGGRMRAKMSRAGGGAGREGRPPPANCYNGRRSSRSSSSPGRRGAAGGA